MPAEQVDGFADNWAYLRTELHWLERLLMAAVAKQRKESKEIDRVAQSKADRATSHWWKGIITTEGNVAYDEYRQPTSAKASYNSQIELQIQATIQKGVVLALPALRERLGLNLFEKNLVLMSLAPEVNRRYARLYRFLQGEDSPVRSDLPTLDLVLRLLCKNDQEWRTARNHLMGSSRLIRYKLLNFLPATENTLLNSPLKLTASLVNYLLAEQPTPQALEELLRPVVKPLSEINVNSVNSVNASANPTSAASSSTVTNATAANSTGTSTGMSTGTSSTPLIRKVPRDNQFLQRSVIDTDWLDLILPDATLTMLKRLAQRQRGYAAALEQWELMAEEMIAPGVISLLVGASGTGKTIAAHALASELQTPLYHVNLAAIDPANYSELIYEISKTAPAVLLIQAAELWLKRSSALATTALHQFLAERRQVEAVTLLSVEQLAAVHSGWRRQIDQQIDFPLPDLQARLILWQRAFPPQVCLDPAINWQALAESLPISGGKIQTIGQEAMFYAADEATDTIKLSHVLQALEQRGWQVEILPLKSRRRRKSSK